MSKQDMTKKVSLSQVLEDLNQGLTKWKKDDIGFGSLEKKYNLLPQEAVQLFAHPKIVGVESKIPTFVIIDDIPDETPQTNTQPQPVLETKQPEPEQPKIQISEVRVEPRVQKPAVVTVVKESVEEEAPALVPFI